MNLLFLLFLWIGPPIVARSDEPKEQQSAADEQDSVNLIDDFFGSDKTAAKKHQATRPESPKPSADTDEIHDVETESDKSASQQDQPKRKSRQRVGERIEPVQGFEVGQQMALLEQRPLLIVLGAGWCDWCRQLENELTKKEAAPILRHWVVTKVDVDREPEVASELQANALPSLRILDGSGDVVATRTGYVPLPELETWLNDHADQADPILHSVLFASDTPGADEIEQLIELLSRRTASVRAAAAGRLSDHQGLSAGAVVDQLRGGSLSTQLAALDILVSWHAPVIGIDPWDPDTINAETTSALVDWLRELPVETGHAQQHDNDLPADPRQAGRILRELIDAHQLRHAELIERAISFGDLAATEAKRMESTVDSLTDSQRRLLRQVRYSVLAGRSARLSSAGLIESLAQLDGPTHYAAAEKLLLKVTSQGQPLVDELSADRDPLVRELAVSALHRIGALTTEDRMRRLLADESPTVRTAVLRQLAEDPSDEITQRLVEYLQAESDEDLLIYATKTLGKLAASSQACDALADLISDDRWRVRAAALDAVGEFVNENSYVRILDSGRSSVSEPIADAVLERTSDPDAFVAKKAQFLLPHVISKRTAASVAQFLLSDRDRAREIIDSVNEYERGQRMIPLIELCKQWLDGDGPQQHADAALLMTEISPTTLRYRLDDLLRSDEQDVRMAALRAFIPCMTDFRSQSVNEELEKWRLAFSTAQERLIAGIELIRPVPDAYHRVQEKETDPQQNESAAKRKWANNDDPSPDDSFDQIDSFFGKSSKPEEDADAEKPDAIEPESDDSSPLDLVASLFGGAATTDSSQRPPVGEDLESSVQSTLDPNQLGLASYWMQRWLNHDSSISRPTWIRSCEPILRTLTESDDSDERLWAGAALLTCGDAAAADELLGEFASDPKLSLSEDILVSWLPADERLNWVRENLDDLISKDVDDSIASAWTAATLIDSIGAAGEIETYLRQSADLSDESSARFVRILRRVLGGGMIFDESETVSADDLKQDESGRLSERKDTSGHPKQADVVQWLLDRYRAAPSNQHRAVLLAVLANVSRRHATAEALAIIEESTDDSILLHAAITLALGDLPELSVDRAVVLLDHSNQGVVDAALRRLTSNEDPSRMLTERIDVPTVDTGINQQHPLQLIQRPLSPTTLSRLSQSGNATSAAIADTLLLSLGNEMEPDALLDRLDGVNDSLSFLTIALAKAGRIDDAAIDIYRRCAESVEWYDSAAIRHALSSLRDDRVKKIIKTHLQDSDDMFSW